MTLRPQGGGNCNGPRVVATGREAALKRVNPMNLEKYTERARGFVQSAQSLALREGHQQFTPEHLLKVLLDDEEGLCAGLIDRAGGNSREALRQVELALAKLPKVQGSGAGQLYLAPTTARIFDNAEKIAQKAGDFVRHRRAASCSARDGEGVGGGQDPGECRRHTANAERGHQRSAQRAHRRFRRAPRTLMTL